MMSDYFGSFEITDRDLKLNELAMRYHTETEAFDRTVCTGPIIRGSILPNGGKELAAISRNARAVFERLCGEAAEHGISRSDLWRANGRSDPTAWVAGDTQGTDYNCSHLFTTDNRC